MKFARYLEETQVPEWKRAYIDYRGLKKCITAIRKARDADGSHIPAEPQIQIASVTTRSSQDGDLQPVLESPTNSTHPFPGVQEDGKAKVEHVEEEDRPHSPPHVDPGTGPVQFPPATSTIQGRPRIEYNEDVQRTGGPSQKPESTREQSRDINTHVNGSARSGRSVAISDLTDGHDADVEGEGGDGVARVRPDLPRSTTVNMGVLPLFRRSTGRSLSLHRNNKGRWELGRAIENHWDLNQSVPLAELMPQLTNKQKEFFEKLDSELDKVETFYVEREKEMKSKTHALKMQLHELQEHRKRFHEAQAQHYWLAFSLIRRNAPVVAEHPRLPHQARKRRKFRSERSVSASRSQSRDPDQTDGIEGAETEGGEGESPESAGSSDTMTNKKRPGNVDIAAERGMATGVGRGKRPRREIKEGEHLTMKLEPEDYLHAKKKLKKALLECYRGLEVLNNYRTLNVIGFRKALKKFEKVTKIPAQQAYFAEKIEPNAFYSSRTVESLLHETEELFAARFTRGDKKRAQMRLRGGSDSRSHHISTFLAGLMIGFAVPAFVDAVYLSFQADTRAAIPGWDGLLFVYSIFLVPVVFSLLVGLNLAVWSIARINYVFIFGELASAFSTALKLISLFFFI
ncbi:SPX domain-containing protein [Abortiporus biennis]|nr:SPX domain-containing protein [Abortiporus biennis]